ncbi:MAG: glycerol kinase GlpK [Opitutus sp.]
MRYVLALDQSTSATKALLFDEVGRCVDQESLEHQQFYPQPGWVEHDPEEIWQNALSVLRAVAARSVSRGEDLLCLSITNQRETIVVFERTTGRPLHRAIVWQCRRGDSFCAEHREAGHEQLVHERTGLRLDAYFSASKLQWLVRNHPDLRGQLESGEALIGTIDAYLIYRLTGRQVFATDSTNASRTLLYDIGELGWDDELCALWEVPRRALPEVRESAAGFGDTTLEGALGHALPIRGVMGDSQASLFAQRCYEPGMAKATFGTGSSILLNIGHTLKLSQRGVVTTLAWVQAGEPTYAFEGIIISSAATLSWLRDQLGLISDFDETEKIAASLSDCDGVYFVPAFSGLGLPHWQPRARAALLGLSSHSDRRHVVRAALESIAYQLRDALEVMRTDAALALRGLHGDGRPTTNRWLMQFTADVTRTELRVATMSNCSALGAALAGLLGLGVYPSLRALAELPRQETRYQPSMPAARAHTLFTGWQSAVRQILNPFEKCAP